MSWILVLIKSTYAAFYWSLILTLKVSRTVFKILIHKARQQLVFPTPHLFDTPTQGNPSKFLLEVTVRIA